MGILDIRDLSYTYRGDWFFDRYQALRSISLDIREGESFGFLGHNGAGKTTTIKCVLNLIQPSEGEIQLFGKPHSDPALRSQIGFLPEHPYFYDNLSVREIMEMFAVLAGISRRNIHVAVQEALETVGMEDRIESRMRSLSKGLVQRVGLAQALVGRPKLLILDEPFSGLDPLGRKSFRDILMRLKQQGVAIFLSSHILSDVEFLCDRVSIMVKGTLKGVFDIREYSQLGTRGYELVLRGERELMPALASLADKVVVETDARDDFTRCTFRSRENAERALALALQSEVAVESFQPVKMSLEDLFIELVGSELREGSAC